MSNQVPDELRYTEEHEWVRQSGPTTVRVGITDYAQSQLGDVVFVQLPDVGGDVTAGESFGEVESTKSVSDIYAPLSAKVVARNGQLDSAPETVNADPYGDGWLVELEVADPQSLTGALAEMLDAAGYRSVTEG